MSSTDWNAEHEGNAALTPSQVKALLLVALHSHEESAAHQQDLASAEQLLLEMSRARGASSPDVLASAARSTTSVPELIRIKEVAKLLIREAAGADQRQAAQLLYHVSVASAFVHHDAVISSRPMRKHQVLYERFADRWDGHPLGRLFRRAAVRIADDHPSDE
jgi:hypothetical protein